MFALRGIDRMTISWQAWSLQPPHGAKNKGAGAKVRTDKRWQHYVQLGRKIVETLSQTEGGVKNDNVSFSPSAEF